MAHCSKDICFCLFNLIAYGNKFGKTWKKRESSRQEYEKPHRLRLACLMADYWIYGSTFGYYVTVQSLFVSAWFRTLQNLTNDHHTKHYHIYIYTFFFFIKIWKLNIITVSIYFLLFSFFSVKRCPCSSRMKYIMGAFLRQVQNGAYFIY